MLRLGEAELALGRHDPARQAFEQSRLRAREMDNGLHFDACAALARVALTLDDVEGAVPALQVILDHVEDGGSLNEAESTAQVGLRCYQVLDRAGDPRAAAWLVRAHDGLQAQAALITEGTLRQSFLKNIPHHREIVAAWAAWQQIEPDGTVRQ